MIALSILRLVEWEKAVVEGAGATGLAACMSPQLVNTLKGKKSVFPLYNSIFALGSCCVSREAFIVHLQYFLHVPIVFVQHVVCFSLCTSCHVFPVVYFLLCTCHVLPVVYLPCTSCCVVPAIHFLLCSSCHSLPVSTVCLQQCGDPPVWR